MTRGEVYWCDLGEPVGSAPAKRRPVLVIQSDDYNDTRLQTTIVVALTSNTALSAMPGNVFLDVNVTGLPKDCVANVTAIATVDRRDLHVRPLARVPQHLMDQVDRGLRQVLDLA
ncbi:type II toxin-antitoxin system PemK/MazF family toxin [Nocardioides baekrokdamisoli]|uniref:type II toxin-antitoxin system PemK/MazF family toxin n=1 Tax=Nocardioides baekrokdamisoli TaxID=1804624 RepID=UPI0022B25AC6|nr:type II toxin-antitoxin system PemK/MazF family toxin [Nocardioides baekrokdamisoli]